jgi:hypothetical protein
MHCAKGPVLIVVKEPVLVEMERNQIYKQMLDLMSDWQEGIKIHHIFNAFPKVISSIFICFYTIHHL